MLSRVPIPLLSDTSSQTNFEDSIANICWNPLRPSNVLATSSWDSKIRLFRIVESNSVQTLQERATLNTDYPCLSLSWMGGLSHIAAGSIDGTISLIDTSRGQSGFQTIGKHDDAVKGVHFSPGGDGNLYLLSVSYDQTLKVWDLRQQGTAVKTLNLGAKAVCSDMTFSYMIVGLSSQKFLTFNISQDIFQRQSLGVERETTLGIDQPISSVSIGPDRAIGIGSLSGRSALSWLDWELNMSNTFCFRAQQLPAGQGGNKSDKAILYPINAVGIHPENTKTYFTAGKDGVIHFWDTQKRRRIKKFETGGVPVTEAKWSPDGKFLAYGCGYDWSIGIEGAQSYKNTLRIHKVQPDELAGHN